MDGVDSHTEISPSGHGFHTICNAIKPGPCCKKMGGRVEIYGSKRFIAITGDHLPGTPTTIEERQAEVSALYEHLFPDPPPMPPRPPRSAPTLDDEEVIRRASAAKNGAAFAALWRGDLGAHGGDHSAADAALCRHLNHWTGGDREQMERLWGLTGLYREKYERDDYRQRTLDYALRGAS